MIDILAPNNVTAGPSFTLTGPSGTATLVSATPWTSGTLAAYLGDVPGASPNNPIGAFLPSTQALDPGATGFFVYAANFGTTTLQSPSNPNASPLENITSGILPQGSYVVAFFNEGTPSAPNWSATANSGAIFETSARSVPDGGMTVMLLGGALVALASLRRKLRV